MREYLDRPAWMLDAACRGLTALMFPTMGQSRDAQRAKALCASCPVRTECLEYASELDGWTTNYGVWAGRTDKQMRKVRAERREAAA